MITQEIFRRNLREIRNYRDLSQEDLAHLTGKHRNFIGMLERGERNPSFDMVDTLCEVLGVEPKYFFTE